MPIHSKPNINLLIGILENEFNRQSVVSQTFVNFFNNRLEEYHEKRFNYTDLQHMNKCILSDCYQFISNEEKEIEKNTIVLKPPPSNHGRGFQTPSDNVKTSKSDSSFDDYKKQYNTMLNPNKPKSIDFSDTIEDEPIQNIDTNLRNQQKIINTPTETPRLPFPNKQKYPQNVWGEFFDKRIRCTYVVNFAHQIAYLRASFVVREMRLAS